LRTSATARTRRRPMMTERRFSRLVWAPAALAAALVFVTAARDVTVLVTISG